MLPNKQTNTEEKVFDLDLKGCVENNKKEDTTDENPRKCPITWACVFTGAYVAYVHLQAHI